MPGFFGVPLHKHFEKIVLSAFIERALKFQDLAIFEIRVDHVQIMIRSEYESAKLAKLDAFRKTFLV